LALGANAKTADNSNAIVTVGESYIRIPQGVSNVSNPKSTGGLGGGGNGIYILNGSGNNS
jgi:hypothetical protein